MKPPTKRELQKLAVEALGEGATAQSKRQHRTCLAGATSNRDDTRVSGVYVYGKTVFDVEFALAAALRALAEVKRD